MARAIIAQIRREMSTFHVFIGFVSLVVLVGMKIFQMINPSIIGPQTFAFKSNIYLYLSCFCFAFSSIADMLFGQEFARLAFLSGVGLSTLHLIIKYSSAL